MSDGLRENSEKLHTTPPGELRIRKNLSLDVKDVVGWCREIIGSKNSVIGRKGKNWYVKNGTCVITVNARSYTVITAHCVKPDS